jgi:hypothetical protein
LLPFVTPLYAAAPMPQRHAECHTAAAAATPMPPISFCAIREPSRRARYAARQRRCWFRDYAIANDAYFPPRRLMSTPLFRPFQD